MLTFFFNSPRLRSSLTIANLSLILLIKKPLNPQNNLCINLSSGKMFNLVIQNPKKITLGLKTLQLVRSLNSKSFNQNDSPSYKTSVNLVPKQALRMISLNMMALRFLVGKGVAPLASSCSHFVKYSQATSHISGTRFLRLSKRKACPKSPLSFFHLSPSKPPTPGCYIYRKGFAKYYCSPTKFPKTLSLQSLAIGISRISISGLYPIFEMTPFFPG